jgi:peroxiredoxin
MRLQAGQAAPAFSKPDIHGQAVTLDQYRGRHLLLSFYRFASCPFCNLRVHELIERAPELDRRALALVAVFQSARAGILKYVGRQRPPFPIIADPDRELYRQYGVESSLRGLLAGVALHAGRAVKSMSMGFLPGPMDGGMTLVPADFLIGPDGAILTAYYGREISDHLPVEAILATLQSRRAAAEGLPRAGR